MYPGARHSTLRADSMRLDGSGLFDRSPIFSQGSVHVQRMCSNPDMALRILKY